MNNVTIRTSAKIIQPIPEAIEGFAKRQELDVVQRRGGTIALRNDEGTIVCQGTMTAVIEFLVNGETDAKVRRLLQTELERLNPAIRPAGLNAAGNPIVGAITFTSDNARRRFDELMMEAGFTIVRGDESFKLSRRSARLGGQMVSLEFDAPSIGKG